jgi:putative solute:sodium symporter small subunit
MSATLLLLGIWFVVTFVASYAARSLDQWTVLGLPLGYVIAAQGALIVYLLLIAIYAHWMNRLDREFGVDEQ